MENTSGLGEGAVVPPEIDGWNWGAFLLNWIWGIGNNTFIALLMFVPVANLVMPFVLGAKGSAWAWRNKRWQGVDEFRAVQRKWARWGLALLVASLVGFAGLIFAIAASFKSSEAFQLAFAQVGEDARVTAVIGVPVSAGFPLGEIQVSGPRGSASLSFSVKGPRGEGSVFVEASKDLGRWQIDRMVFEDSSGQRIDLVP